MGKLKVAFTDSRTEAHIAAEKLGDGLYAYPYPLDNAHYGIVRCRNGVVSTVWRGSTLDKFRRDELTEC